MFRMKIELALLKQRVDDICKDIEGFVTLKEFAPIQRIVYGTVGLILTGVALAIIKLVIK